MRTILDYLDYDVSLYLYDNYIFKNHSNYKECLKEYNHKIYNYKNRYHDDIMKNLIVLHKTPNNNTRLKKVNFVIFIRKTNRKKIYRELTPANKRAIQWKIEVRDSRRTIDNNHQRTIYKMILD